MSEILEKLSSYNIFNYLLPGVLLVVFLEELSVLYRFLQEDIVLAIFLYYFIGLVISRLGSLILEPLLKKVGFIQFFDYSTYLSAVKLDYRINKLSEINNMYRTLCTLFIVIIGLILFENILTEFASDGTIITKFATFSKSIMPLMGIACLLILFLFSYRKQTNYIKKHVEEFEK